MRATKNTIIKILKDAKPFLKSKGIEEIALFGSFAKEEQNVYSDIDLAIQKEENFLKKYSAYEYFEIVALIKENLQQKLHRRVDLFDLDSDSSFKSSIQEELIYV